MQNNKKRLKTEQQLDDVIASLSELQELQPYNPKDNFWKAFWQKKKKSFAKEKNSTLQDLDQILQHILSITLNFPAVAIQEK